MKDNALVFLADEKYLDQVKQMVYSARSFGHWEDDIVLLTWGDVDAQWFEKRGVIVVSVNEKDFAFGDLPKDQWVYFAKMYLFHPYFTRWKKLIYLDTDMLIRKDIRPLLEFTPFAATDDCFQYPVIHQLSPRYSDWTKSRINQVMSTRDLNAVSFNSGMMVISTELCTLEYFHQLCEMTALYWRECAYYDQGILNMVFNPIRERVPYVYNDYYLSESFNRKGLIRRLSDKNAVILHIIHPSKPWQQNNPYHLEWRERMEAAELQDSYQIGGRSPSFRSIMLVDFINKWNIRSVYFWGWWLDFYRKRRWRFYNFIDSLRKWIKKMQ